MFKKNYLKNYFIKKFVVSSIILLIATIFWQTTVAVSKEVGTGKLEKNQTNNLINMNNSPILILQLVEHPALDATRQGIIDELKKAGIPAKYEIAQNNSALAAQIAVKYISESPKAVVGIATLSAQALVAANRSANIPVLFSSVTDPLAARLVSSLEKHPENVTGVSNFVEPSPQFAAFKKILPKLKTVGIIYNPGEPNSVHLNTRMQKAAKAYNIDLIFAPANNSVDVPQATRQLLAKVDAIFINNDNTALSAFEAITKIAKTKKIPVFVSDVDMVSQGALAALGPNQYEIGKQTAKLLLKVLAGEKTENLPILFPDQTELFLNLRVAKELGISIPDSVVEAATKIIKEKL